MTKSLGVKDIDPTISPNMTQWANIQAESWLKNSVLPEKRMSIGGPIL